MQWGNADGLGNCVPALPGAKKNSINGVGGLGWGVPSLGTDFVKGFWYPPIKSNCEKLLHVCLEFSGKISWLRRKTPLRPDKLDPMTTQVLRKKVRKLNRISKQRMNKNRIEAFLRPGICPPRHLSPPGICPSRHLFYWWINASTGICPTRHLSFEAFVC